MCCELFAALVMLNCNNILSRKLVEYLVIFLQLDMVNVPDLRELGLVVSVLDGLPGHCGRGRVGVTTLVRSGHTLCYQHVVQSHELWVWRILE